MTELRTLANGMSFAQVFGAVFRTPPKDSTGLPHILEHSVLCGSRKYPCKEPFVELIKGSMNTFLNAFTYPERTCCKYPWRFKKDRGERERIQASCVCVALFLSMYI